MTLQNPRGAYIGLAILVLDTLLVCAGLNLGIFAIGKVNPGNFSAPTPTIPDSIPIEVYGLGSLEYDFDLLQQVYYYREDSEIIWLLLETWNQTQICDEYGGRREGAYRGRYINVDEAGFRWIDEQGPWPPDENAYNIFVFGNSTLFGYGESDNLTMPSYLQYYLRQAAGTDTINVYNFGRGNYFSLLEKRAFQGLIDDGYVPDLAIFFDGLMEFNNWDGRLPDGSKCLRPENASERLNKTITCRTDELCFPAQVLAFNLLEEMQVDPQNNEPDEEETQPPYDDVTVNTAIINRWLENKSAIEQIAQEAGIDALFVMQPVPAYAYDLQYHLFANDLTGLGVAARTRWGYAIWEDMYADPDAAWTENVLNLARLGEDDRGPIYLDSVHYTFGFMDEIGNAIAEWIMSRQLIPDS